MSVDDRYTVHTASGSMYTFFPEGKFLGKKAWVEIYSRITDGRLGEKALIGDITVGQRLPITLSDGSFYVTSPVTSIEVIIGGAGHTVCFSELWR